MDVTYPASHQSSFCRIHGTLKMTPAMASGVVDELWTLDDLLSAI